ncbi:MAG: tRNA (N6-isopentenyl adenosine(37)-C2)-methylthiotransferase MiaB [Bacteroidetes bacterium]|nr:tRNA (N6-isopentenyl adenosine(37)-C2)-methylthiotransferase MiaB [Bacteroidota bacterium]
MEKKQRSFFIKTFGCQMNERDSEIISQSLGEHGYIETMQLDESDLIVLNTCSIRSKAEQKVMSLLGMLRKIKKKKPSLKICVAGCVAQQEGEKLIRKMPHIDLVVGTQSIYDIPRLLLENDKKRKIATQLEDNYEIPQFIPNLSLLRTHTKATGENIVPFRKFVTIMQGCNNFCTYCVVPHTRGREISRNMEDIREEVNVLVEAGVKEITLLGQNVNSYGIANPVTVDKAPYSFPQLLHEIARIRGLERLRFTTSHPKDLSDDLMRCFRDIDIVCPQFHLPVQAGSNNVLKRMNRKYTIEDYLAKVKTLREYCPDIVLTTDVIAGFPGETDEDFERTMQLLEEVKFAGSFSFKYSDRPGTVAINFQEKVEEGVKSARLMRFQKRQDEISLEHNSNYVGRIMPVMVESTEGEQIKSRSVTNHIVHIKGLKKLAPGDTAIALITHAGQHSLQGEIS